MKKSTKFQTIVSLILIFAVLAFGVIAYTTSQRSVTSKVKISIPNNDVQITLQGDALWVTEDETLQEGTERTFTTETTAGGLKKTQWIMPNVTWTNLEQNEPAVLKIAIGNIVPTDDANLNFEITGLKYDNSNRFETKAKYQIGTGSFQEETFITQSEPKYTFSVPASSNDVTILIEYTLLKQNTSFDLLQLIEISISQEAS